MPAVILLTALAALPWWWGSAANPTGNGAAGITSQGLPIRNKLSGVARKAASAKWFLEQRTYPFGFIPQDAEIRALEDMRNRMIPELQSQGVSLAKSAAAQLNWEFLGPGNIGGRLRGLLVHPNNPNLLYVGSASGGVWRSTDGGATWSPTMNDLVTLNISALAFKPGDPNTLYAGTGEAFLSDALPGRGLLKSTDGGATWRRIGPASGLNTSFITELAVTPANPNLIFASGREAVPQYMPLPTETTPDRGVSAIFRSTDAGEIWQDVTSGKGIDPVPNFPFDNMPTDVVVSPTDANTVYAAFGVYFESGGIWKSTNGGQSWTRLTNGLPNPATQNQGYGRIELAMAPSNPNVLYTSFTYRHKQGDNVNIKDEGMLGIWKTTDAGQNWTQVTTPQSIAQRNIQSGNTTPLGGQGNYDNAIIVHPTDPNTVFVAGLDIYKSTDGGNTWSQISFWIGRNPDNLPYVHADHHVFAFDRSTNPPTLYNGSDGGIARTRNLGASWDILNRDLGVTQFYYLAVHPTNPNIMLGGSQDNGTPTSFDGNRNNWFDITSGDGGPSHFDYNTPTTFYASVYRVNMTRYFNFDFTAVTGQFKDIGFTDGSNGITQDDVNGAAFFAPYELSPNNPNTLVLGTNRLLKTTNQGDSWTAISSTGGGAPIVAVAIAEGSDNIIWLATRAPQQGKAQIVKTENGGTNYTNVTGANLPDRFVTDIEFDPSNNRTVYLTYSGYGTPHVFKSTNAGGNWTDITNNLPDVPVNCAQVHPQQPNVIFIGTDIGVFMSDNAGQVWQPCNNGLPTVQVVALILNTSMKKIFAGTHGRGAYSAELSGGAGAAALNVNVSEVNIQLPPGTIRSTTFNLGNAGTANLSFNITATGPPENHGFTAHLSGSENGLTPRLPKFDLAMASAEKSAGSNLPAKAAGMPPALSPEIFGVSAVDVIVNDDGNNTADDFFGFGPNSLYDFFWLNRFTPAGFGFRLEAFDFYMRTESAAANPVYVAVLDVFGNILTQANLSFATAPNGGWYTATLNFPLVFGDGEPFAILVGASRAIPFPAGTDVDAAVPHQSFYFNPLTNSYVNLNNSAGFQNGAFLIRAKGTKIGVANLPPVAIGVISKTQATVNETITFDASQSSDPDGQITQYRWEFGDGGTSNLKVATHAYSQPGTYSVRLTVTDNQGATGQAQGQVMITGSSNQPPMARAQVSPNPAAVNQNVTFDASGSSDPDGQITQYLWNFGDGASSTQRTATHAYAQAGTYTYTLTVTDNAGATGQTSGQISITAARSRLTVSPVSGVVTPGGAQTITVTFDAQGLAEGNYQGQLNIVSNGGNSVLPVRIVVSSSVKVDEQQTELPRAFSLEQNYPNPFSDKSAFGNSATTIRFNLPRSGKISLAIYDVRGALIKTLESGNKTAGEHIVRWDGRDSRGGRVASGVYFYRLEAVAENGAATNLTKKLMVVK
ncbi:MAG: PKD domain-containing protein [bacterium]